MPDPSHHAARALIERLGLRPHPEGGWYREEHRSAIAVRRPDGAERAALTLIWFLLQAPEISRWHRVVGGDETWHHAGGDPLELWVLPPEGGEARPHLLGPLDGPLDGAQPVRVVPANWWQAARCLGAWSLVTCCVGPGFDFHDFQLLHGLPASAHPPGARGELL
ncbi:MAG: cupin domain-containing protein [Cyanobacteriota bacterium]|nr:cupin domain-containing protein [Cyanobacteriota bacterium]